jgi:hypothetical protein
VSWLGLAGRTALLPLSANGGNSALLCLRDIDRKEPILVSRYIIQGLQSVQLWLRLWSRVGVPPQHMAPATTDSRKQGKTGREAGRQAGRQADRQGQPRAAAPYLPSESTGHDPAALAVSKARQHIWRTVNRPRLSPRLSPRLVDSEACPLVSWR